MKKIIALIALPFLATPAMADNAEIEKCIALAEFGSKLMEIRQMGIPMTKAISHFQSDPDLDDHIRALLIGFTEAAYMSPYFHTKEAKAREAARFSDMMFQVCREG